jgi:hypothetical protein
MLSLTIVTFLVLSSKTLLLPQIVLLIGTEFGASATNAFVDDQFKNIGVMDDVTYPVGFVDKIEVIYYSH